MSGWQKQQVLMIGCILCGMQRHLKHVRDHRKTSNGGR